MHALCCGRFWHGYIGTSWHCEDVWHDANDALICLGRLLGLDLFTITVECVRLYVVFVVFVQLVRGWGHGGHLEPKMQKVGHGPIIGDVVAFMVMLLDVWQSTNLF